MSLESLLEWTATGTGIIAAVIVSLNLGARVTGWGFVIFTVSSVCWIATAVMQGEMPLTIQNGVLFVINLVGIWRYLFHPERQERKSQAGGSAGATAAA